MGLAIKDNSISVYKACIKDANSLKDLVLPFLFILTIVKEFLIMYVYIYL